VEITERFVPASANISDVHPKVANIYRRNMVRLTEALDDPDGGREAARAPCSLIGEIVLIGRVCSACRHWRDRPCCRS
jgi:site-specific DNA recombinase